MNVVLVHPMHGAKIAINEAELAADEKNGWVRYTPEASTAPVDVEDAPAKRKYTRKAAQQTIEQPNEVPEFLTSASDESEG